MKNVRKSGGFCSRTLLHNCMQDEGFAAEFDRQRNEIVEAAFGMIAQNIEKAVTTLVGLLDIHCMPPVFGNILMRQQPGFGNKIRESTRGEIIVDAGQLFLLKLPPKRIFMAVQGEYSQIIDVVRRKSCLLSV